MITTEELLKETGISYPTLTRLKDLGIIAKPSKQGLGNRRGVIGVFPDEVVSIINWVKQQQACGLSLVEIAGKWRQAKMEEGELVTQKPNTSVINWATNIFAKLHAQYPHDDFVPGEIEWPLEEKPDGTVIARFRLRRVPREHK
ncbi:MAG: hypothetical protein ABSB38_07760 [Dehalococcoidia bacterium]